MNIMYKCSSCGKMYDWYEAVYEKPTDKNSIFVRANCFKLMYHAPVDVEQTVIKDADGNLDGMYINLCEDCMHKLLDTIQIDNEPLWDMV